MTRILTEQEMDHPEQSGYLIYIFTVIKPGETTPEVVKASAPDWQKAIRMLMTQWPNLEVVSFNGFMNPHVEAPTA